MKALFTAALLLVCHYFAFSQLQDLPKPGGELHIGLYREYVKQRDQQVSPMMYVSNLNGLRLSYARLTPKNQWIVEIKGGLGDLVAPKLGIRDFKFSDDQQQPIRLVPTLYKVDMNFTYSRKLQQNLNITSWAGISLQESFNYADGIAMTTWVMNTLSASLTYQTQWYINKHNSLIADASLPVLSIISRMPYSNVVSQPDLSNTKAFLKNSRLESIHHFLNPQVSMTYCITVSRRVGLQATYRYSWLRYPEPRLIRAASHTGNLSFIYQFQFQYK